MTDSGFAPLPLIAWVSRRSRRQVQALIALVALYLLWRALRWTAAIQLDRWWLDSVTSAPVWRTRTAAIVLLAAVSGLTSVVVMAGSWIVANRTDAPAGQPTFRPIAFVAGRLGPARTWAAWVLPLYFGLRIMSASTNHWQKWVLFRNSSPTGVVAPEVGYDVSYHLFTLPLLVVVLRWLTQLLLVTLAISWALLVMNGALRLPIRGRKSNPVAIRIMLGLGALLLLVQAFGYWFVRYPILASSGKGRFSGGSWAELHGRGLAYRPLAIMCLIGAVLLIASVYKMVRFRWSMSFVGAIVVGQVAFGMVLTPVLQRLVVRPSEFAREQPYLGYNLTWTRQAFGLDSVQVKTLQLDPAPTGKPPVDRVPRFEQTSLAAPVQVLQGTRGSKVIDVDLDRYQVDGERRPVFVAARVAAKSELPDQSWVNTHLIYTHGDGVVAALADTTTPAGGIEFDGLQTRLGQADTRMYFGAGLERWYVVVGTARAEFEGAKFDASTGVPIGTRWRQLVSGLGMSDYNLMFSSDIGSNSQLLYRRSITERIRQMAPFLSVDADPYPVITKGGVVWMVDTYVTSDTFPYSQRSDQRSVPGKSDIQGVRYNYLQHAAVATIDAYDGTVRLYRADDDSPLVDAWDRALPGLFTPLDEMPPEIAQHRRYPTDLYTVQTNLLGRYHVDSAEALYSGDDAWLISPNVQAASDTSASTPARAVWQFVDSLGGDWVSTRPLSPGQAKNPSSIRQELAALAIGDHDTGELTLYRTKSTTPAQIPSPQVAQSILASDPEISQLLTLLNANGSTVVFGPNTPIINGDGLWWYRTIVVNSTAKVSTPRLHSSLAVSEDGAQVLERTESVDLTAGGG